MNQIDLVDIDIDSQLGPRNHLVQFVQPGQCRLRFARAAKFARCERQIRSHSAESLLSWFGLASSGLGGMSSAAASLSLVDQPYTIDPRIGVVADVPLAKWSSKSFIARWTAPGGGIESALTASADRRLQGTITNRLPSPLDRCVLFCGRWAYPLGNHSRRAKPCGWIAKIPARWKRSSRIATCSPRATKCPRTIAPISTWPGFSK